MAAAGIDTTTATIPQSPAEVSGLFVIAKRLFPCSECVCSIKDFPRTHNGMAEVQSKITDLSSESDRKTGRQLLEVYTLLDSGSAAPQDVFPGLEALLSMEGMARQLLLYTEFREYLAKLNSFLHDCDEAGLRSALRVAEDQREWQFSFMLGILATVPALILIMTIVTTMNNISGNKDANTVDNQFNFMGGTFLVLNALVCLGCMPKVIAGCRRSELAVAQNLQLLISDSLNPDRVFAEYNRAKAIRDTLAAVLGSPLPSGPSDPHRADVAIVAIDSPLPGAGDPLATDVDAGASGSTTSPFAQAAMAGTGIVPIRHRSTYNLGARGLSKE